MIHNYISKKNSTRHDRSGIVLDHISKANDSKKQLRIMIDVRCMC